jgi:L-aminopeptidase/D-esterase-like protein
VDSAAYIARGPAVTPRFDELAGRNTTLCVVSTNAAMDRVQLASLARAASAALYRRITPVGTMFDGDVIFTTSPVEGGVVAAPPQVEALAVLALEQAIERSVRTRAPGDLLT